MSYQLYVGNQCFNDPFALIQQGNERYTVASILNWKDEITRLILRTPIGQDISREVLLAQFALMGLSGNNNTPTNEVPNGVTYAPRTPQAGDIYYS